MLTKSLHTVTAATNVAAFILQTNPAQRSCDATALAKNALAVLNQFIGTDFSGQDPTVTRIVEACAKLLAAPRAKVAA